MAVKKTTVKKTVKATVKETEDVKTVASDIKVKMLRTHFNILGIYNAGEEYTLSSEVAKAYIKAGDAEEC